VQIIVAGINIPAVAARIGASFDRCHYLPM